ncbi:MAG: transposase [Defluviitaleaceae bacterium]|nr:transposase [Defluviitaleaceae bacterium]
MDSSQHLTDQQWDLTDRQWEKIDPIINARLGDWGGANANDNRLFVNACLYILRTKSPWHQLPPKYGKYKAINRRFNRWRSQHIWDDVLVILLKEPDYEWLIIEPDENLADGQLPTFSMAWLNMVSPSRPLFRQIEKQFAKQLTRFK